MALGLRFGILLQAVDPPGEFAQLVQRIEALGFDHLWVADSSLHARYVWNYLTIAALHTTRIKLGTGVTHPFTRHPAVNLNAVATLNEISGGRAILGLGAGDRPVVELGLRPAPPRVVGEMIDLCRELITGAPVHYNGSAFRVDGAHLSYGQQPTLPMYVAASGPQMLTLAGEKADGTLIQVGSHPDCVRYALARIHDGANRVGRGLTDFDASVMLYGSIREDRDLARAEARPFAAWIPQTVPVYCEIAGIPEADAQAVRDRYTGGELHQAEEAAAVVTDDMIDWFTLAGNAAECRHRVAALLEAGIQHVTFFAMGEDRIGSIERFAAGIMKPLRG